MERATGRKVTFLRAHRLVLITRYNLCVCVLSLKAPVTEACFRVRRACKRTSTKRKRAARRLAPAERSSHGHVVTVASLWSPSSTFSLEWGGKKRRLECQREKKSDLSGFWFRVARKQNAALKLEHAPLIYIHSANQPENSP